MVKKLTAGSDMVSLDEVAEGEFENIAPDYSDDAAALDDVEMQMQRIFEEFGGDNSDVDFKIHVKRILKDKGELSHVFVCLPSELPILDRLRDDYGGGRFEVWINRNGKRFRRRVVVVEPPPKRLQQGADGAMQSGDLVAAMSDGFLRLGDLIAGSHAQVPVIDPVASMEGMLRNMVLMREAMGGNNAQVPVASDPLAVVERVVQLQQLLGDKEKSDGATTADLLIELTRTFGGPIAQLTMKAQDEADAKATAPATPPAKEHPMKMQLMFLLNFAKKNVDPAPYAQMVIDQAPNLPELVAFISQSDAIDQMIKIYPKVAEYRGWFVELGECVLEFAAANADGSTVDEAQGEVAGVPDSDERGAPDSATDANGEVEKIE